jgi:NodT family efflux transporter outer membrane factor (OMF) lipoprotein
VFSAGFDASWEPDVFGRLRAGVQASEADARAAQASLADVQVTLAAEVAVNYIELRGLQQRLQIARSNLASQQETLQIAQWRLQAGLTTSLVTEQARAAAEQTAAQVPALQTSLAQSRHSLAVLTGQPPAALDVRLAPPGPVPTPPGDLALDIPAQTLRQRPDVRAAEHRVAAAAARVAQADAARYPDFSLSGSLGLRALTLGSLTGGNAVASGLAASLAASLFDGGAAQAQVRSQQAGLEQARVNYEATVLTALKDVEDALVALQGDRERLGRLQAAADAAANAALMAQQRYTSGLIDFATVLETQRTQLSAQDSVAATVASVAADHVRLYKALGGGWQ